MGGPNPIPPTIKPEDVDRVWANIQKGDPDACWPWVGYFGGDYPAIMVGARKVKGHRLIYFLTYGIWNGEDICHKCDNPACCNPRHLFHAPHQINMQDCINKGRFVPCSNGFKKGSAHRLAKLTESQVSEIKTLRSTTKITHSEIARRYGVGRQLIGLIINKKRWSHVD